MSRVRVSLAIGDYDHVRDLTAGRVVVEGVDLLALSHPPEQIFARFTSAREWDMCEFSLAKYTALVAAGDTSLVGLPVFPSRMFRHSSIYVRSDSAMIRCEDLAGLRIGVPEWAQTAAIYSRGMLEECHGVSLLDVQWVQAGVNEPGRREKVDLPLLEHLRLDRRPDSSLNALLQAGDVDAVLSARAPRGFTDDSGTVRRLLADPRAAEQAYFAATAVFPIMHLVVMRADVHERNRWVARNMTDAFETAKRGSLARLADVTASQVPLPWTDTSVREAHAMLGADPWPYGIDAETNQVTLDTFLRYAHQQGITARRLAPADLFAPSTVTAVRV